MRCYQIARIITAAAISFGSPGLIHAQGVSSVSGLTEAWRSKVADADVATVWQACSAEMTTSVYRQADRDLASARCATAALATCTMRRKPGGAPSMAACLDAELKRAALAAIVATPRVEISDLTSTEAKAAVASRIVAQASTLNAAHGRKISDEEVVCQRTPVIGSNIPGPPVCATKREWRVRAETTQAFVSDFEQRNAAFGAAGR